MSLSKGSGPWGRPPGTEVVLWSAVVAGNCGHFVQNTRFCSFSPHQVLLHRNDMSWPIVARRSSQIFLYNFQSCGCGRCFLAELSGSYAHRPSWNLVIVLELMCAHGSKSFHSWKLLSECLRPQTPKPLKSSMRHVLTVNFGLPFAGFQVLKLESQALRRCLDRVRAARGWGPGAGI